VQPPNEFLIVNIEEMLGHVFTCNHIATQRGESVNSVLKEKGQKKKELRGFNLQQLLDHLLNQFNRWQSRSLDQICDLIKSKKKWSNYVHDIWTKNFLQTTKLPFAKEVSSGCWKVSAVQDFSSACHSVTMSTCDVYGIPTCSCHMFKSCLIPCPGICTVFGRIANELFDINNLHPRWRLSGHPLYQTALSKLNLTDRTIETAPSNDNDAHNNSAFIQSELDRSAYDSVVFPSKRDVRYSRLNQEFKKIEGRIINNEHWYRLMMLNLAAFGQAMQDNGTSSFILPDNSRAANEKCSTSLEIAVQPPAKRGRYTKGDDVNKYVQRFYSIRFL
jgi:hypothetical protein